jgi:signal transduction histidine kinase
MNEEEINYKSIFESSPELFLVLKPDTPIYTIVGASDAYLSATMTRREDIKGLPLFEAFPDNPEDIAATGAVNLRKSLDRVVRSGKPDSMAIQKYDIRKPASEGGLFETRYWSPLNTPVPGKNGELAYIIHRVEDATEQVNEKKDEFIEILCLELREPLINIKGNLELIQKEESDPRKLSHMENTKREIDKLSSVILELMDASLMQSEELQLHIETFPLQELLTETVETVLSTHKSHRIIQNNIKLEGNIGGDKSRLKQVIEIILQNAIKYSPTSDEIILEAKKNQNNVAISVTDFGIGISPAHLELVFDRFHRVEPNNQQVHGLGLGLYVANKIVQAHKGRILVESELGKGSTFKIILPLSNSILPITNN